MDSQRRSATRLYSRAHCTAVCTFNLVQSTLSRCTLRGRNWRWAVNQSVTLMILHLYINACGSLAIALYWRGAGSMDGTCDSLPLFLHGSCALSDSGLDASVSAFLSNVMRVSKFPWNDTASILAHLQVHTNRAVYQLDFPLLLENGQESSHPNILSIPRWSIIFSTLLLENVFCALLYFCELTKNNCNYMMHGFTLHYNKYNIGDLVEMLHDLCASLDCTILALKPFTLLHKCNMYTLTKSLTVIDKCSELYDSSYL